MNLRTKIRQERQPQGTPVGGQFAGKTNPESTLDLTGDQPVKTVGADGIERWHLDGGLHRADGPAIKWPDGSEAWFLHGELHRADGPAVTRSDGTELWWERGRQVSPNRREIFNVGSGDGSHRGSPLSYKA